MHPAAVFRVRPSRALVIRGHAVEPTFSHPRTRPNPERLKMATARKPMLLIVLQGVGCCGASSTFHLPSGFEGLWEGVPFASVAGPWSQPFRFSISRTPLGDYVFEDNLRVDTSMPAYRSWQRTYIIGSGPDAGLMLHCPGPRDPALQRQAMMQVHHVDASSVTFCLTKWDGYVEDEHPFPFKTLGCYSEGHGCECFNWTMRIDVSHTELEYRARMAGSPRHTHSMHLFVDLRRVGEAPAIDMKMPGEEGRSFTCDYAGRDGQLVNFNACPFTSVPEHAAPAMPEAVRGGGYSHCYVLNKMVGVILEWELDEAQALLRVQASAPAPFGDASYIALGFRPWGAASGVKARSMGTGREHRFGMRGADIVLGHAGGLETMYAEEFTGPPERDDSLPVSDGTVAMAEGWISMSFTRPLVGGRLHKRYGINASIASDASDMMWSVGRWLPQLHLAEGHGVRRGWREVNWTDPEADTRPLHSLRPYKCLPHTLLL